MDLERIAPFLAIAVVLGVVLMGRRQAPGATVVQTGPDYSQRVEAAEIAAQHSIARMESELASEQLEAEERVAFAEIETAEELRLAEIEQASELQREELRTQREKAEAEARARRAEADAERRAREVRARQEREAADREHNANIAQTALSFIGTVITTVVGLSGDTYYTDEFRRHGLRRHAGTQWAMLDRSRHDPGTLEGRHGAWPS